MNLFLLLCFLFLFLSGGDGVYIRGYSRAFGPSLSETQQLQNALRKTVGIVKPSEAQLWGSH